MPLKRRRAMKPATTKSDRELQPSGDEGSAWKTWWPCLLIAAMVFAAFLPMLGNDFVQYDDPGYVTKNPPVQEGLSVAGIAWAFDPTTIVIANWHPLTMLSHMLDCQLYGLKPAGHHFTSLLFHVANSVLLFLLLKRMTGALWCSLVVAAWFGLHPAHVESVAWVAERKDVLSGLFWMLTLLAYAEYVRHREQGSPRARIFYLLALGAFLLGLLSKPMLVTLPFVLLRLDYWPLRRLTAANIRPLVLEKTPFFLLTIASCVVTFLVQKQSGAMGPEEQISFLHRIPNALVSYLRYVGMLAWPTDLTVFYPFRASWPLWLVVSATSLVVGVTLAAIFLARRCGYWAVGWFWFFGTLVPVIGLVQVGEQSIADRYSYLPSIGLFIAAAWVAQELCRRWRVLGAVAGSIGAVTALACFVATRHQIAHWSDGETLFRRVLTRTTDHYLPHLSLGIALIEKRRYEEAITALERARELNPKAVLIHLDLGYALMAVERTSEAVEACREATRVEPKMAMAWGNLGGYQMQAGDTAGAVESFQQAVTLGPKNADMLYQLGIALRSERRLDEADRAHRRALELKPNMVAAREEMIKALILQGQLEKARMEWRTVSGLVPGSVVDHNSFGVLLAELGHIDAATSEFEAAHRIDPKNPDTNNNLARAREFKASQAKEGSPSRR